MKLSKLNRVTHRDIGYLIAGLSLIYAISGITLNHKNDFNANYIVDGRSFQTEIDFTRDNIDKEKVTSIVEAATGTPDFKTFYYPSGNKLNIFIEGGSIQINTLTGEGRVERISKRPVFYQFNFLHYNPGKWWKWFSDIYCIALILVTITGLFIVKGKNGITRRGAILTIIGIILPLLVSSLLLRKRIRLRTTHQLW